MIPCAVYGCGNNSVTTTDPSIQYYYFPKQPEIAEQWIRACSWQENAIDLNTARICSIHFASDCFTSEYKILNHLSCYTKVLKYDAVPTLYLPIHTPLIALNTDNVQIQHTLPSVENFTTDQNIKLHSQEDNLRLHTLKQENATLQQQVNTLKSEIDAMRSSLNAVKNKYREAEEDCNSFRSQYCFLQVSMMALQKQKALLAKVFSESQIKILSGKKKIYWSNDDMAMGYTIRHLSNKRCYTYLSKNLNIPLPALSSLKRWATIKKNEYKTKEKKS